MNSRLQNQRRASARGSLDPRPSGILQRKCDCGQHTGGSGECEECKKKDMTLQRQSNSLAVSAPVPPVVQDVVDSPGRPLDPDARAFMEPRFGRDFSQVRVHTDAKAAHSADAAHARAYTVGRSIVFGSGQYSTHTEASKHLLAHELAHVVQQNTNGVGADSETKADLAANCVSQGKAIEGAAVGAAPVSLQRSPNDGGTGGTGATTSIAVAVDRIDVLTSSSGAVTGYPAITSGNLNSPGPWNDPAGGGVSNVHQIHFHLDKGNSSMLTPRREIQRSSWRAGVESKNPPDKPVPPGHEGPAILGGFSGVLVGPDGPAAHEVKRPTADKVVVADAPGAPALAATEFPYIRKSHFRLIVANDKGADVASIRYDVEIEKKSKADVPNTKNTITPVEKKDIIRGKTL